MSKITILSIKLLNAGNLKAVIEIKTGKFVINCSLLEKESNFYLSLPKQQLNNKRQLPLVTYPKKNFLGCIT